MAASLSSWVCCVSYKYAFEDFAIRQAALLLNKTGDETKYANRSLVRVPFPFDIPSLCLKGSDQRQNYRNVWDPDTTSDGFQGITGKPFRTVFRGAPSYNAAI